MKVLLLVMVVLAGVWLWRTRQQGGSDKKVSEKPAMQPLDMVRCTHCGLHLPSHDAVQGGKGPYCSQEHLHLAEP